MKQQTLAIAADQNAAFERFRRPTRRDRFLATMEQVVPWDVLCSVVEPHYPKPGNGRPPVARRLRRFVGIDLGVERVPDAATLLKFRRLNEANGLEAALFA